MYHGKKKTCQVFLRRKMLNSMTIPVRYHPRHLFSLVLLLSLAGCGISRQAREAGDRAMLTQADNVQDGVNKNMVLKLLEEICGDKSPLSPDGDC